MGIRFAWAGPALSAESAQEFSYVSPAAAWWNSRLVASLQQLGAPADVITHIPSPIWPRGDFLVPAGGDFEPGISGSAVGYLNIPLLRQLSLARGYGKEIASIAEDANFLITYNASPFALMTGASVSRDPDWGWMAVVADSVSDSRFVTSLTRRALRLCSAMIYLSWHDFVHHARDSDTPSLHLDGGVDVLREAKPRHLRSSPTVVYSGALNKYGGLDILLQSMRYLDRDIRVVVSGKGSSLDMRRPLMGHHLGDRLTFVGLLNQQQLHRLYWDASCFVNPRPVGDMGQHNFPSKVLRYLAYGQPIASTRSPGLSPEYEGVLTFADSDSPRDLAAAIETAVLAATSAEQAEKRRNFAANRTWSRQAARMLKMFSDGRLR